MIQLRIDHIRIFEILTRSRTNCEPVKQAMHRVWAVLKKQLKQGSILFQLVVHPNQFHLLAGKLLVSFQRLLALSWTYVLCL